jgi:hypothetical protein
MVCSTKLVKPISSSVAEKDRHETAFSFPGGGLWQFKRMLMGLSNSASVFEKLMERNDF